jgi:hypothetical protein
VDTGCPLEQTRHFERPGPDRGADASLFGHTLATFGNPYPEIDMAYTAAARRGLAALTLTLAVIPVSIAGAQQPAAAPPAQTGPKVGEVAPDFMLPGATRYGLLKDPVTLSAMRGKTVVLAFFFKARTRG